MKKMTRMMLIAGVLALLLTIAACSQLDVIGNHSVTAFEEVLNALPDQVSYDEAYHGWSLTAPDGSARFIWTDDWSKSEPDAMLAVDAEPFLIAGLNPGLLPEDYVYQDGALLVGRNLGDDETEADTPLSAYRLIVQNSRGALGYHMAMDHFGVDLRFGMFEWAKDMAETDKDIVFVLNPEPLIAAGVNPNAVDGWAFGEVEVHQNGKQVKVEKFLKPFDLK